MSIAAHISLEAAAEIAEGLGDDNRLATAALGFTDPIYLAMYEEVTGIDRLSERIDRVLASDLCLARLALLGGDERTGAHLWAAEAFVGGAGLHAYGPALRELVEFHMNRAG
jgi:hypothetical protein